MKILIVFEHRQKFSIKVINTNYQNDNVNLENFIFSKKRKNTCLKILSINALYINALNESIFIKLDNDITQS